MEDADRLDDLAERLPFVSRHALARAALKIGFAALEADPRRIVDEEMVKPPSRRKRLSTTARGRGAVGAQIVVEVIKAEIAGVAMGDEGTLRGVLGRPATFELDHMRKRGVVGKKPPSRGRSARRKNDR